jgi:hypothetical protein
VLSPSIIRNYIKRDNMDREIREITKFWFKISMEVTLSEAKVCSEATGRDLWHIVCELHLPGPWQSSIARFFEQGVEQSA